MPLALLAPLALSLTLGVQIDPAAVARDSDALLRAANTVQGSYTVVRANGATGQVQFVLERPNNLMLRSPGKVDIYNGQEHIVVLTGAGTYERRDPKLYGTPYLIGFTGFLDPTAPTVKALTLPTFTDSQVVTVAGKTYVRRTGPDGMSVDIDAVTKLPARWTWRTGGETLVGLFEGVTLDAPVPAGAFDTEAAIAGKNPVATAEETALPAIGSTIPALTTTTLQRRPLDLMKYVAEKRATVVAFINPRSQESADGLASLGTLSRRRDLRNLGVVAFSTSSDAKETQTFLRNCRFQPPTVIGAEARAAMDTFGVKIAPTFLVIDPSGTVRARTIGYDEAAILAALDAKASG